MGFAEHMQSMPKQAKKKAKKKDAKKVAPIPKATDRIVEKPIAPIIKVIEQPDYSPMVEKQATITAVLAEQAMASMRDSVNNNQVVMAEIMRKMLIKPIRFIIKSDNQGNLTEIIPVYKEG